MFSGVSAAAIPNLEKSKSDSPKLEEESKIAKNLAVLATNAPIQVPQHKSRQQKGQTLLISNKMPQHHAMIQLLRRNVILRRIHLRTG